MKKTWKLDSDVLFRYSFFYTLKNFTFLSNMFAFPVFFSLLALGLFISHGDEYLIKPELFYPLFVWFTLAITFFCLPGIGLSWSRMTLTGEKKHAQIAHYLPNGRGWKLVKFLFDKSGALAFQNIYILFLSLIVGGVASYILRDFAPYVAPIDLGIVIAVLVSIFALKMCLVLWIPVFLMIPATAADERVTFSELDTLPPENRRRISYVLLVYNLLLILSPATILYLAISLNAALVLSLMKGVPAQVIVLLAYWLIITLYVGFSLSTLTLSFRFLLNKHVITPNAGLEQRIVSEIESLHREASRQS